MNDSKSKAANIILGMDDEEFSELQLAMLDKMSLAELWSYMCLRSHQEDFHEDAVMAGERAIKHADDYYAALYSLANVHYAANEFDKAAVLYEELESDGPDANEYAEEANDLLFDCYFQQKKFDLARDTVERALKYKPDSEREWLKLREVAAVKKDYAGTLRATIKISDIGDYNRERFAEIWGLSIKVLGTDMTAEQIMDQLKTAPLHVLGAIDILLLHQSGEHSAAAALVPAYLDEHRTNTPKRIQSQLLGMVIHNHMGNQEYAAAREAIDQIWSCVRDEKEYANYLNYYGIILSREDRKAEALDYFKRAIQADPEYTVYYQNFIHISHDLGLTDHVLEYGLQLARLQTEQARNEANPHIMVKDASGADMGLKVRVGDLSPRDPDQPLEAAFGDTKPLLPVLIEASIDLKLTEDGQVKIIETNDMYMSGYEGFKRAYNKSMRGDCVLPYHRELEKILESKYGHKIEIMTPGEPHSPLPYMVQAVISAQQSVYTSASLPWKAINSRKDYLHLTTPGRWEHLFPRTVIVPRSKNLTARSIEKRLQALLEDGQTLDDTDFIMKPCNDSIGRGVELVSGNQIVPELHQVTSWSSPEGSYWNGHKDPNIIVQECIRSKPVQAQNGRFYDGTMRIAFTALLSPDGKTVEDVKFYRPYWKLPANAIGDDCDTGSSVISFPPSSLNKDEYKDRADDIPVSARVGYNDQCSVEHQLRPYLKDVLPQYALSAPEFAEQMQRFIHSRSDTKRAMATDLTTAFTHASAIGIIAGRSKEAALQDSVRNARWNKKSAAAQYREYLFDKPVESPEHAVALAFRAQSMLESRLGLQPNEVHLEPEDWVEAVEEAPQPKVI